MDLVPVENQVNYIMNSEDLILNQIVFCRRRKNSTTSDIIRSRSEAFILFCPRFFVTFEKLLALDNPKKNEFSFGIVLSYS